MASFKAQVVEALERNAERIADAESAEFQTRWKLEHGWSEGPNYEEAMRLRRERATLIRFYELAREAGGDE